MNRNYGRDDPPVVLDARVVTGAGGGPEKTILNSPRFLERDGYRMVCAYLHPPGDAGFEQLRARAGRLGAPLLPIEDRGAWDWQVVPRLLQLCRRERVTIWHGHDYKSNALGLLVKRFWPMHLVTTVHGWVQETPRLLFYYGIDRVCLPRYEAVLCVSPDLVKRCRASGVAAERCLLLENGIDTDTYRRRLPIAEAKRRLGVHPERLAIGAVGRLSPEKCFDVLIRATDRLLANGHDVDLVIAGDGEERGTLERLIAELGHGERIRLLGFCADPQALYEALDVFALSSVREGLPNVLLEALAYEVPAVASNIAGVPRLIRDAANGLIVEPGDVEGLTLSLARLLTDETLRQRLGSAGRRTVESDFSFAKRMRKLAALYDSLLAGRAVGLEPTATMENALFAVAIGSGLNEKEDS